MITGFPGMCCLFPLEAHRHNLLDNAATSLAFDVIFRDFRLFCFDSHEKSTQSVLASAVPIMLSFANTREG